MTAQWNLRTEGDSVGAIQGFLSAVYERAALDGMLVPMRVDEPPGIEPRVVEAAQLTAADPFAPFMAVNAALLVTRYVSENPGQRLGAVLRPCEIRALRERAKRESLDVDKVFLVGVDCVGTFDMDDVNWRGSVDELTRETLHFARQGGVVTYRYRPACQMCTEPMPEGTHITVDVLGLPAHEVVLISTPEATIADDLRMAELVDGPASPNLIDQHEHMRASVTARRARARQRIIDALDHELAMDLDTLIAHLESCETCQDCLNACAIYPSEVALHSGERFSREIVTNRLSSCAGCGMCEAACTDHLPLTAIFTRIREELLAEPA